MTINELIDEVVYACTDDPELPPEKIRADAVNLLKFFAAQGRETCEKCRVIAIYCPDCKSKLDNSSIHGAWLEHESSCTSFSKRVVIRKCDECRLREAISGAHCPECGEPISFYWHKHDVEKGLREALNAKTS